MYSLSCLASVDTADLENDPDLRIKSDEPDSWSATMDKKTLKKINLSKKDSKRQENIFGELLVVELLTITIKSCQIIRVHTNGEKSLNNVENLATHLRQRIK